MDVDPEVVEQDVRRAYVRIQEAIGDASGRIKLYLNNMAFPTLDSDVERVRSLEQLHCQNNPLLRSLPYALGSLLHLRVLNASHCSLEVLPEELSKLRRLERVDLSHNRLQRFLWDVSSWGTTLLRLDISYNQIRYFSPSCVALFQTLQKKYAMAKKVQLVAEETLVLWPNADLFRPEHTNHCKNSLEEQAVLSAMLPDQVERCMVCDRIVLIGRPRVYVHFWVYQKALLAAASDNDMLLGESLVAGKNNHQTSNDDDDEDHDDGVADRELVSDGSPSGSSNLPVLASEVNSSARPSVVVEGAAVSTPGRNAAYFGNGARIPIFYPLCTDLACHVALHKSVLIQFA